MAVITSANEIFFGVQVKVTMDSSRFSRRACNSMLLIFFVSTVSAGHRFKFPMVHFQEALVVACMAS